MVRSMGGCCQICKYKKFHGALEFHHIDPSQKKLKFGAIRGSPRAWDVIAEELKKCILLCSICHRELEAGLIELPVSYFTYDASIEDEIRKESKDSKKRLLV